MKVKKCLLDYCDEELSTLVEVATGLCDRHTKLLESNKSYAGLCWKCHRIQVIQEIPRHLDRAFTEKYLFSNGCSHCTENLPDYQWLTFNRFEPLTQQIVSEDGSLTEVAVTQNSEDKR